jgi:protoporphyrinogen oxidase
VVIGAGPAGLTAAYELSGHGVPSVILEADGVVGGLSRTAEYKGYLFDIGGHRFFTRVPLVEKMWREVLGDDFIRRPRLSRIYYRNRFFLYPLEPLDALAGLGPVEALRCGISYVKARLSPQRPEDDLETWVSNRFGRRLFEIFFKTYTEKVWGISCKEIRADWAAQRIKGLSLKSLVLNALIPGRKSRGKQNAIKTLIREFDYPRRGPGMMWARTREIVESRGCRVVFNAPVEKIYWEPGRVTGIRAGGRLYRGRHFISSMPVRDLLRALDPAPEHGLIQAADDFHYRDFLTVVLIVKRPNLFPDNWIYIHEPGVKAGRIQNYGNWSPEMVPDAATSSLGLEYFCFEGDGLWTMPDRDLIALGKREVARIGLAAESEIADGTVVRVRKAYPVYDETYERGLGKVRQWLAGMPNLQLAGRNGMHRYNNQDHSMLTAMLAARNILAGRIQYDLWRVNVDADYHEEGGDLSADLAAVETTQPMVPGRR